MKRILEVTLAAAVVMTTAAPALAQDWRDHDRYEHHYGHYDRGRHGGWDHDRGWRYQHRRVCWWRYHRRVCTWR